MAKPNELSYPQKTAESLFDLVLEFDALCLKSFTGASLSAKPGFWFSLHHLAAHRSQLFSTVGIMTKLIACENCPEQGYAELR